MHTNQNSHKNWQPIQLGGMFLEGIRKLAYFLDGIRKIVRTLAKFGNSDTGGQGNFIVTYI